MVALCTGAFDRGGLFLSFWLIRPLRWRVLCAIGDEGSGFSSSSDK